jgi:dTDP-4-dehydrorhamnose 3,5-epimerase
MNIVETKIPNLVIIEPKVFGDERGFFLETYNADRYKAAGIDAEFVQDNLSFSRKGILRGLHYQKPMTQGKLVQVLQGEVYDVAVDIRVGSPTFGEWEAVLLSETNKRQLYVPEGFAHGFVVLSATADLIYKCTALFDPEQDCCLMWNDPDIGIEWPAGDPIVSEKDNKGQWFKDLRF